MDKKAASERRGGPRAGAGRPAGSGTWGESTSVIRVPHSKLEAVKAFLHQSGGVLQLGDVSRQPRLPLYGHQIRAGFPSPADDYVEDLIDLHEHLVKHPSATFLLRVRGDSMTGAGIHNGDLLIVDRSLEPSHGRIVIAVIEGELTVKRLWRRDGCLRLLAENPAYAPIEVGADQELVIWGVVTSVIHGLL